MDVADYGGGQVLASETTSENAKGLELKCPRCGGGVFFKGSSRGKVRRHFAHYAGGACLVKDEDYENESQAHQRVKAALHKRLRKIVGTTYGKVRMETRLEHEQGSGVRICDVTAEWKGQTYSYEIQENAPELARWMRWMGMLEDAGIQSEWIILDGGGVTRRPSGDEIRYEVKGYATKVATRYGRLLLAMVDKSGAAYIEEIPVAEAYTGRLGRIEPKDNANANPKGYFFLSIDRAQVRRAAVARVGLAQGTAWGEEEGRLIVTEERHLRRIREILSAGWGREKKEEAAGDKPEEATRGAEAAEKERKEEPGFGAGLGGEEQEGLQERPTAGSEAERSKSEAKRLGRERASFDALSYIAKTLHEGSSGLKADATWSTRKLWSCEAIEAGVRKWNVDLWTPLVGHRTSLWWIFAVDPRAWQMVGYCSHFYYTYAKAYRERIGLEVERWGGARTGYVIRSLRESGIGDEKGGGGLFRKSLRRLGHWVDDGSAWITKGSLMHLAVGGWFERLREIGFLRAARPARTPTTALRELGDGLRSIRHRNEGRAWTMDEKRDAMQKVRSAYIELAKHLQRVEDNSYFAPEIFHPPYMREEEHAKVTKHMDEGLLFGRHEVISQSTGEILREETFEERSQRQEAV